MKRVLCYGDSNTWGYVSGSDHLRYNDNERWTKLLQKHLSGKAEIIEEGLNSRTLFSDDNRPGKEGRNGFSYFIPCLDSHDKVDVVVLMLGTNELKFEFNNSSADIVVMIDKYVQFVKNYKSQIDKSAPKLIISGVPKVNEFTDYSKSKNKYLNATQKSIELNNNLKLYCEKNNLIYVDNTDLETGVDGVHLTLESHCKLAERLANIL